MTSPESFDGETTYRDRNCVCECVWECECVFACVCERECVCVSVGARERKRVCV